MKRAGTLTAIGRITERWRRSGKKIGFVPTMGALHAAHMSLVERARKECDRVVVSIFVNPAQFGPQEDFTRYPRPRRRDDALCRENGVDALYRPRTADIYPPGFRTFVEVTDLSELLCGRSRPGHFRGVATVVLKLLEQVRPHALYLGEKDFQQLVIVRRMVRDLNIPARVIGCRTRRERDGLALSSRNNYLRPQERSWAPRLYRALRCGAAEGRRRGATPGRVLRSMRREAEKIPGVRIDYLEVIDADTLRRPARLRGRMRLLGAVRIGETRLIDNIPFTMRPLC
ncbi:MAG: pantoate--beta-alanine ligase [Elusimicrobiota bacterium]